MSTKTNNEGRDENGKFTERNIWAYVKKNVGRPRVFNTPEELLEQGMRYFEWADDVYKGKYAEADLRMFLGFYGRTTWFDYKHNPEFANAIYILECIMEGDTEKKLMWAGSTQGAIFKLKNKYGWKDEVTQHQTVTNVTASFGNPLQSSQESANDSRGDK